MAGLDDFERGKLEEVLASVEARLAASLSSRDPALVRLADQTRNRLGFVSGKIDVSKAEEKQREREARDAAVTRLAQEQAALTARERETFSGFLEKDFFTKADFGALEKFYTQTWDRLNDEGKDAMSHRIWEGVRRNEYEFAALPHPIRDREMEHAFKRLNSPVRTPEQMRVPDADREDFIRAYESGKKEDAAKVLDRGSFRDSMFRGADSKPIEQSKAIESREGDAEAVVKQTAQTSPPPDVPTGKREGGVDGTDLNLSGIKLADASSVQSSREIPTAQTPPTKNSPSLRGG